LISLKEAGEEEKSSDFLGVSWMGFKDRAEILERDESI
jgi:hypothetical protein